MQTLDPEKTQEHLGPTGPVTQYGSLDREDALEEGMATHSSIFAWRIPWIEELGGTWGPTESDTIEVT